jgi:exosome complex component RRP41
MGNTKVICTVSGPQEGKRTGPGGASSEAKLEVEIAVAGFSGVDRKKRSRTDKSVLYICWLYKYRNLTYGIDGQLRCNTL